MLLESPIPAIIQAHCTGTSVSPRGDQFEEVDMDALGNGAPASGAHEDAGLAVSETFPYQEYDVIQSRGKSPADDIDYNVKRFLKSYESRAAAAAAAGTDDTASGGGEAAEEDVEDSLYNAITFLGGAAAEYWACLVSSTRGVSSAIKKACSAQMFPIPTKISAIASKLMKKVAYCTYNVKKRLDMSDSSLVAAGLAGAVVGTQFRITPCVYRTHQNAPHFVFGLVSARWAYGRLPV